MAIQWTKEQRKAIESRNRNLLVSAAAGSGKTAVLVERIIQMISPGKGEDGEAQGPAPIDIDQLLVMTFTKAAAAEMRERVAQAIGKRLEQDPGNQHLQLQAALIPHAQITTIDSFCLSLIREHFNNLDLDPAFRIVDQGEAILLQAQVMKEMLEDFYQSGDPAFQRFVEAYATGKADDGIGDYIQQVHGFSQSNPWPELWISQCRRELSHTSMDQLGQAPWMEFLMEDICLQARELGGQVAEAIKVCQMEGGPAAYEAALREDLALLKALCQAVDYQELSRLLEALSFSRLAAVRSKEVDPDKKEQVSATRDRVKKAVGKMRENYSFQPAGDMAEEMGKTQEPVGILLDLAKEYGKRYQEAKKEKNLVDFNDLEHFALDLLVHVGEDGRVAYTDVADQLSQKYQEILVDEYQDSNQVQETLVKSISRERFGFPNVFMVGDVKQSIYKFRLARPELFLEKYKTYGKEDGKYQKVELHQNFRSRSQVLEGVNDIFYRIMTQSLGNITYTEDEALHPGACFAPLPKGMEGRQGGHPELLMVHASGDLLKQVDQDALDYTARELEAKMIARRIRQMTDPKDGMVVWDKEEGGYRRARHGDMVILLRSTAGWMETFLNVLLNEGIPAHAESRTGYFNTMEVEAVLSMLRVIDNPIQDIPLAAVLKSPMAGLTDQELAHMVSAYKRTGKKGQDRGLYGAWSSYLEEHGKDEGEEVLYQKLAGFYHLLQDFRRLAEYLPIHELIYQVYGRTGFYDFASAMPAGATRRANLDMLVEKAAAYEKTSYKGLFHFVQYIEKLKKYNTDFGEASVLGEDDDTVRIMSIHKSKGLEFPIVFLAGMGKKFNKQDARGKILIDPDLGIATDYLDLEQRLKAPTLKKNVVKRRMELEALGEELRVLYVAMTRAKEKLVMTATDRYLDKKLDRFGRLNLPVGSTLPVGPTLSIEPTLSVGQVPFTVLALADSYLDWVLISLLGFGGNQVRVEASQVALEDLAGEEVARQAHKRLSKREWLEFDVNATYDAQYRESLEANLHFQYPYAQDIGLHTAISVSELKKYSQGADMEEMDFLPTLPAFMRPEKQPAKGAFRGTAYHRVLELLDFSAVDSLAKAREAVNDLHGQKRIDTESFQLVSPEVLWRFLSSPLGRRMAKAQKEGRLHKEQQFVVGIPAREMEEQDSDELVLVQGVIDAYFEEDGKLVLVDYKTDWVLPGQEKLLEGRYAKQLAYYQKALEQMTGRQVAERIIYSLALNKAMP